MFEEVSLAITDPEGYFEEYQEDLKERGIEEVSRVAPWLALVDGLLRRRHLAEVDWKSSGDDLAWNLDELRPCRERRVDFKRTRASTETDTSKLLLFAAADLTPHSLSLLMLDIDSDSYPIVVLPTASVEPVLKIAKALGEKVETYAAM